MKLRFFILLLALSFSLSKAQMKTVLGETKYPFWIHMPENSCNEPLPILVFLHGKSLSGTTIERVKRYGVLNAILKGQKIPAIVIAPQVANGAWNPDYVLELIEYVQKNYNTDLSRVYICGMSLGGYGTLHFAGKYPEKITAAVAICGGGYEKDASNLATVPLWIIHGNKDRAVPLSESLKVVNAIKKQDAKAPLKFTIIKGGTHGSVENTFHSQEMYDWLFSHTKENQTEQSPIQ